MIQRFIPCLFTCGPLVLALAAWVKLFRTRQRGWPRPIAMAALSTVSANALFAACVYLYYSFRPSPALPPWEDTETLDLAMLFLLAPIGIVISLTAAARGSQRWLIGILGVASMLLLLVGALECSAV